MTSSGAPVGHIPVLYKEILEALQPAPGGRYVDGTVGAGGHARGILGASRPDGLLLGMDLDPQALAIARENLQEFADRVILAHASYVALSEQLAMIGWSEVQGILLDLGVSSMQLDTPVRGFSFQVEAPLDMRFDPANPVTAADLVNGLAEAELAEIIYRYGDEQSSRRIARAIVQSRPLGTTQELAAVVLRAAGGDRPYGRDRRQGKGRPGPAEKTAKKIHPATRTFQALRIAVNQELDAVEAALPKAIKALAPGGRLAVISFHSLEDRMVKQFFRQESKDCLCPPKQPVCTCGHRATIREITRRPIQPQASEAETNPRSRSARLRVAEKLSF